LVYRNALPVATVSSTTVLAGPVDEDLTHCFGGNAKEVAMIGVGPVAEEPKVSLMHRGGGIERVIAPFSGHLRRGQPAQLVVNQRQ
jgi:hypothetical protein